ncbi:uncharacterized protein LOC127836298 [Dreissena polymorpha]|uniref:Uncharacterized protein n=1 Tax=Dreissena polymorpha TaxID=45954 RepID=A0A9D4JG19_DREPO|nr:uncharacterized protein LOC127836298 [Dreissena polymorpha]XP_052218767.1 uncharacterized protein LOC127836298 [Dreissena polymorpha]XP_052218768.1 uncharacterized protein LOC127836298 [Dreissena polymorpha]XP_052218769.1 uncharacterized protein LOC127836298 [Dreissena polymorpha]KAH3810530.1 hypothetical protein DPMN_138925 [Dreissena polymorpha]
MSNMRRWQAQLCALATLLVLRSHWQVSGGNICDTSNRTDPAFSPNLNMAEYVRYGMSKALVCCASGFHAIQWHILNASEVWLPYPPETWGTDTPKTEEDGQVLRIYHAMDFQNTKFRCDLVVSNGSVMLSHIISLHVSHCSTRASGPLLIEPFPQNQTILDYGGNISFYCTGDFGCYNNNDVQIVMWSVDTIDIDKIASSVSDRYHLVTNESDDKTTIGVTLTIVKVEPMDTTRSFICTIMNDQFINGQTSRMVWITKTERSDPPTMMIVMAVSSVVGIFVAAFLLGFCIYKCYGPQVKLLVYVHCPCCHRKAMDEDKYEYHVFLYHSDDDGEKAEYIRQNLKERNYYVFISADITPGTETINTTSALFEKSAAVHFLYTENLLHDNWALRFLINLIEDGKDILCLEIDEFKPQKVIEAIKGAQCENEANHFEISTDGVNIDDKKVDRNERVSNIKDIGYWKRLPKIKVPTENDSRRKQENFWSFLQNMLPKPRLESPDKIEQIQRGIHAHERISSASSSLLENELSTHMCYIGPQPEFSPKSDSVFEYPLENANNASMNNEWNAETYIENNCLPLNSQPAKLYEMVLGQVNGYVADNDVTMVNGSQNALEMGIGQSTSASYNRKHAHGTETVRFINQNVGKHDNSFHGAIPHDDLIHPVAFTCIMFTGTESPSFNMRMPSPSDCNDDLCRSNSYAYSSVGDNSTSISGQSDIGYKQSHTSSSFGATSSSLGTTQSALTTSSSLNGSSSDVSYFTDSGVIKHGEAKHDINSFVQNAQGLNNALKLSLKPTGYTHNISNKVVSPESGYSSDSTNPTFISIPE